MHIINSTKAREFSRVHAHVAPRVLLYFSPFMVTCSKLDIC